MEIPTFKIKIKTFKCNKPWCRQQPPDPSHPPFLSPSSQGSSSWPDHHNGIPSVKFIYTIYAGRNCPKMCQKITCMAPKIVSPTCPPRIIPKLSSLEKKELPGIAVTVCFPALIKSGSTFENQSTMCLISSALKGTK